MDRAGRICTAVYRSLMAGNVPAGVPVEAANAAKSTLGGALAVAGQLPDQLGAELLGAAREAFGQAFELTAAISAIVSLATALGATALLRRRRSGSELGEVSEAPAR